MKKISIAIATYNGAKYIKAQLDSLATQTFLPSEIVITDDGSHDDTLSIATEFAKSAPFPVKIIKNDRQLGYAGNFMKAASLCTSELVAFCDQDDIWLPEKLAACSAGFDIDDISLVHHNADITDENLTKIGTLDHPGQFPTLSPPMARGPWHYGRLGFTMVINRSLLDFSDLWPQSSDYFNKGKPEAHDQWFFVLGSGLGTVYYIDKYFVLYRRHQATVTQFWGTRSYYLKLRDLYTAYKLLPSLEETSKKRASIFKVIAARSTGLTASRANSASEHYSRVAGFCRARTQIYSASNLVARVFLIRDLYRKGGYQSVDVSGFGRRVMARDILRTVVFPFGLSPKSLHSV